MDNYYKSSRLHFIGTWKARIEALAATSAGKVPTPCQCSLQTVALTSRATVGKRTCLVWHAPVWMSARVVRRKVCL